MIVHPTQNTSAAALFRLAIALGEGARQLWAAAERLDAWLERRRIAARTLDDFAQMSQRELRDIGLSRADTQRVAWVGA